MHDGAHCHHFDDASGARGVIGGVLVDLTIVAVVLAFAWAGTQLGGISSLGRLIASLIAFTVAALLRDPIGWVIETLIGSSIDFARLLGMLVVGVGVYIAATSLVRWSQARSASTVERVQGVRASAIFGGILGLCWAVAFLAVLILAPSSNVITRAAISSYTGGQLIEHGALMRWFSSGFPHYTQTLPKGKRGVIVGERSSLTMHGGQEPSARPKDADPLLRTVNRLRASGRVQMLAYNPDVAAVAERHALALAADRVLAYQPVGGGALEPRVQAALGESAPAFREEVQTVVAWAHTPVHAGIGVTEDTRANDLLTDPSFTEIGIGIADLGWFDGRIYVLLLIGPSEIAPAGEATGGPEPPGSEPAALEAEADDTLTTEGIEPELQG